MQKLRKIGAIVVVASFLMSSVVSSYAFNTTKYVLTKEFNELYKKLKSPTSGYLSPDGIPYHCIETIMCEAPDYGHEATSEGFSYLMWLEAMNGHLNGDDYSGLDAAWALTEKYMIPDKDAQPECTYKGATYIPEHDQPSDYPSQMGSWSISPSDDKLASELKFIYGTTGMYGMHWLMDVDNFYGYGGVGGKNVFINTFERGPEESTWEVIPHPSIEKFEYGGKNGFLDLFVGDKSYSKQWRYTIASEADARAVQAAYNAYKWSGKDTSKLSKSIEKAAKMGDYLRYAMNDKMLRPLGYSTGVTSGRPMHYLMGQSYSWGGDLSSQHSEGWKIGSSYIHQMYQNPMTAYAMSQVVAFNAKSPNAKTDWAKSYQRQLELYTWLQSAEGPIAGGCSNSYKGRYEQFPAGTATFYGMGYDPSPVYHDPASNGWFGNQVRSLQRVAELYYETGDEMAKNILDKWVAWVLPMCKTELSDGTLRVPGNITWTGQPNTWLPGSRTWSNPDLHATVSTKSDDMSEDVGLVGSLCNLLLYYAKGTEVHSGNTARGLKAGQVAYAYLKTLIKNYKDDKGFSAVEKRADYKSMNDELYIPKEWTGTMPNGDQIKSGMKWIDLRTNLKKDPAWPAVEEALAKGEAPSFRYHRFGAQVDIAMAMGTAAMLFPYGIDTPPPDLYGDVNGDGAVSVIDAVMVKAVVVKKKDSSIFRFPEYADVNRDGVVNTIDYLLIKQKIQKQVQYLD